MADIDIDPFGKHNKTDSHLDKMGKNIPLPLVTQEDLLGNQNVNKKRRLEEGELKKEGLLILTLTVCTRSYLSIVAEPRMQSITITLGARVRGFTSKAGRATHQ